MVVSKAQNAFVDHKRRKHQPREMLLVSQFINEHYPDAMRRITRVRVGTEISHLPGLD